jgi:signal transduction histidine kinase
MKAGTDLFRQRAHGAMASLVHWRTVVTLSLDSSASEPVKEPPRSDDAVPDDDLRASIHAALRAELPELVAKWQMVAPDVLGNDARDGQIQNAGLASDVVTALLAGLAASDEKPGASITVGLQFGMEAFGHGASLHHTGKAFDLLVAKVMHAMERVAARTDTPSGSVTDGISLARQLQRRAALLSLAIIRGYTQAYGRALRDRFRHLRHDLRNPLGTIKSVLALMDDETVPSEARANPNFRAMAKRNAGSLEAMIADRLSDDAAPLSTIAERDITLSTIAHAVRQDLKPEAERRGVAVIIQASELHGRFDAAGMELLLQGTLLAALQESGTGEQLRLEFDDAAGKRATVLLSCESGHAPIARRDTLQHLTALAQRIGASATFSDEVLISVPMRRSGHEANLVMERERPLLHDSVELGSGEALHDLRSPREGDHGQASVL